MFHVKHFFLFSLSSKVFTVNSSEFPRARFDHRKAFFTELAVPRVPVGRVHAAGGVKRPDKFHIRSAAIHNASQRGNFCPAFFQGFGAFP